MDSEIDEDELNERLNLYFEHDRLIRQVEKANWQFESDFEDLSTYLKVSSLDARFSIRSVEPGVGKRTATFSGHAHCLLIRDVASADLYLATDGDDSSRFQSRLRDHLAIHLCFTFTTVGACF
ncbi:hypothetical protein [Halalkalicoccus sp. NIPERK01]|uniref:hypothetical protein n=1 Tax=Halalkalicoccus sp. NIPERK01 TaxID=3053469 RepID=UPI00256F0F6E|nr:hypothetical protein [Halalkalicoccus sp. NIPERK01]MDL5363144.1 hypothetical protein [Halalkalicoccus sp. NIPERK01]